MFVLFTNRIGMAGIYGFSAFRVTVQQGTKIKAAVNEAFGQKLKVSGFL